MTHSDILQGLNEAQRAAVASFERPSLIIAGAGSGKTRVLTSRIAYMIAQGVAPWSILALTFTNKAAAEMRLRIEQMVGEKSRYIRMGTFHSVFSRILRENADRIGFPQSFTIYEPNDVKSLLKTIIKEMRLPDDKYKPNVIASRISYAKNALITPGAYLAKTIYATEDRQAQIPEFGHIYNEYCRRCKQNGAMDFDDLLLQTNILLKDCPDVLARYQEQFQYIYKYSPLHNIKEGVKYPATLVTTADHDDRVVPAHSFKFAAQLQHCDSGVNPTLILIDSKAGHGAGRPRHKIIEEKANVYSFMMYNLGMNPKF